MSEEHDTLWSRINMGLAIQILLPNTRGSSLGLSVASDSQQRQYMSKESLLLAASKESTADTSQSNVSPNRQRESPLMGLAMHIHQKGTGRYM